MKIIESKCVRNGKAGPEPMDIASESLTMSTIARCSLSSRPLLPPTMSMQRPGAFIRKNKQSTSRLGLLSKEPQPYEDFPDGLLTAPLMSIRRTAGFL
jgi:hypothetical protein